MPPGAPQAHLQLNYQTNTLNPKLRQDTDTRDDKQQYRLEAHTHQTEQGL